MEVMAIFLSLKEMYIDMPPLPIKTAKRVSSCLASAAEDMLRASINFWQT
jgi:hypothetical protein